MTHVIAGIRDLIIPCLIITIAVSPLYGLEPITDHTDRNSGSNGSSRGSIHAKVRPAYVRTELKVSRSLNHDDVETIDVKSNTGGLASIIVKKRPEGRQHALSGAFHKSTRSHQNSTGNAASVEYGKWNPLSSSSSIRFAEPTNAGSLQVINSFIDHINKIDRQSRQDQQANSDAAAIKNDRRPVNIHLAQQVPEPTVIRSDAVWVKNTPSKNANKRGKSLLHVGTDGIPVVEGIRVPDDEDDKKKIWRNARVIKGELVPYEKGYIPPKAQVSGELIFSRSNDQTTEHDRTNVGPFTKSDNFQGEGRAVGRSFGPFTVEDNKRSLDDQSGRRGMGPFFVADNTANQQLAEYIRNVNSNPQWYAARSSKFYDDQRSQKNFHSQPQLQRRMLPAENDLNQNFLNDVDNENFRNPVVEYAHPELGIQPARPVPKQAEQVQFKKVQYYVNDIVSNGNNKKKFTAIHTTPLNSNEYYRNDPYYNSYKPTSTYPYNYGYLTKVKEQPFWMKISEQVRDSFQNGMTSVGAITRPVIEPIVEAGHKISENLGFSKSNKFAESKVGVVGPISASSAILPAIGLVAGGAALGIGAMTVGKYFDGNTLKREETTSVLDPEHKRAMEAIYAQLNGGFFPSEEPQPNQSRQKRSLPIRNRIHYVDIQQPIIGPRPTLRLMDGQSDIGDLLQNVEKSLPNTLTNSFEDQIRRTDWSNTPCAKKTFCEVMLHQNSDQMVLMEKKMETLLAKMHPKASESISNHLTDVMQAINQRNCQVFVCVTH